MGPASSPAPPGRPGAAPRLEWRVPTVPPSPEDPRGVALVTGGCSGIGRAMAARLAARGHPLVLVSDRPGPLAAAGAEIRAAHGVPVEVLALDLASPGAAEDLHRRVRALGLAVDLLVSNAGVFFFGEAADADPARADAMLQLHVPWTNRRRDRWGGSLENRSRLAVEVLRAARAAGPGLALLAKVNLRDGFPGGLEIDESIEVARRLESEGADALALSAGFVSRTPLYMLRGEVPLRPMMAAQDRFWAKAGLYLFGRLLVRGFPFQEGFLLDEARRLRAAVRLPLLLLGGVKSMATIDRALAEGFELVGMGRALLHDPDLPRKMRRGELAASGCVPSNECIAEMDRGGVRCTRT